MHIGTQQDLMNTLWSRFMKFLFWLSQTRGQCRPSSLYWSHRITGWMSQGVTSRSFLHIGCLRTVDLSLVSAPMSLPGQVSGLPKKVFVDWSLTGPSRSGMSRSANWCSQVQEYGLLDFIFHLAPIPRSSLARESCSDRTRRLERYREVYFTLPGEG